MAMKKTLYNIKQQIAKNPTSEIIHKGSMGTQLSQTDMITLLESHLQMYEQDLEMKQVIVASLRPNNGNNKQDLQYEMNTYLICWKKQPMMQATQLRELEYQWHMHVTTKNKLGII